MAGSYSAIRRAGLDSTDSVGCLLAAFRPAHPNGQSLNNNIQIPDYEL